MYERVIPQLETIQTLTAQSQNRLVCVEAGHIYTDETPNELHEVGARVGANVCTVLENMGIKIQKMLFIDDYNAESHDLNIGDYQELLSKCGFSADKLVMESSLENDAIQIIDDLEKIFLIEENKNGSLILKKGHKREKEIVLRKSPSMGATPACVALDTALYLKKYEEAGLCVTILHSIWKDQQKGVQKVLKALGKELPILSIFYSEEGEIEVDFDF